MAVSIARFVNCGGSIKATVAAAVVRISAPGFALLMRSASVRGLVAAIEDPKRNVLTKLIYRLYWNWWRHRQHDPAQWERYQKEYWETIGVQRWADRGGADQAYDETVSRHLRPDDRSVVELGCGHGQSLAALVARHPDLRLSAIDASHAMCESARRRVPSATITCGFYGPEQGVESRYDMVIARSTITYVDETAIDDVLRWAFEVANRCVILADPSGMLDEFDHLDTTTLPNGVRKRLHDHTHIRDYTAYVTRLSLPFSLVEDTLSADRRGRTWVFERNSAPAAGGAPAS